MVLQILAYADEEPLTLIIPPSHQATCSGLQYIRLDLRLRGFYARFADREGKQELLFAKHMELLRELDRGLYYSGIVEVEQFLSSFEPQLKKIDYIVSLARSKLRTLYDLAE